MTNMQYQREKQLDNWGKQKSRIEKSSVLKQLLEIYSHAPQSVLSMINAKSVSRESVEEGIAKYPREIIAIGFRQYLLQGGHVGAYKDFVAKRAGEWVREIDKFQEQVDQLKRKYESRLSMDLEKSTIFLIERLADDARRQKLESMIELAKKQMDQYDVFLGLYDEVTRNAAKDIQAQKKNEFKRFARENVKILEADSTPHPVKIPSELDNLATFAFLFEQWEQGYERYKKQDKDYGELTVDGKSSTLEPTKFFREQWDEINPFFLKVVGMDRVSEKLAEAVKMKYITGEQAEKANSYLELAVRCPERDRVRGRDVLEFSLADSAGVSEKEKITADEVRLFAPGLSEDLAEAVAKHAQEEILLERHNKLVDLLSDELPGKILTANPKLMTCDKESFETYAHLIGNYLSGVESKERALEAIGKDVKEFSNSNSLRQIVDLRYSEERAGIAPAGREEMYKSAFKEMGYDMELVRTMIVNGLKLNKKCFGASYISEVHILRNMRTYFKKNPDKVGEFERTRAWLVNQGVVIRHTDKRTAGCTVSLNSHLSEIEDSRLRDFVADIFVEHGLRHRNGE